MLFCTRIRRFLGSGSFLVFLHIRLLALFSLRSLLTILDGCVGDRLRILWIWSCVVLARKLMIFEVVFAEGKGSFRGFWSNGKETWDVGEIKKAKRGYLLAFWDY